MLKGKVAMVVDERRVALNVGADKGVKRGDCFAIYQEGAEVQDPDTGESLGCIELVKTTVTVEHVQEQICVALQPPEEAAPEPEQPDVLSARMARIESFGRGKKSAKAAPIRVGDLARRV